MVNIGGGHRRRMAAKGIKHPTKDVPYTPGGRREGFTSTLSGDDISRGCEEVHCWNCEAVYPAFQSRCPECGELRAD